MIRQEMIQHMDGGYNSAMPKMRAAEQRARAKAYEHIKAALAELKQIGPQSVGIGKAVSDAEMLLQSVVDTIVDEA